MTSTATTATGTDISAPLRAIVDELSATYLERETVVRAVLITVLAKQHSVILGPPGTAKSALARDLTARFTGAKLWETTLNKFVAPMSLFGPIDVAALATKGEFTQIFDGRATRADIAFIDEVFKCSPAALNSLLPFLNERLYNPEGGGAPITCPLVSAVCASNELPAGEETAAIYDRFLVRLQVDYLADPANFQALLKSAVVSDEDEKDEITTVDLDDLRHAVDHQVPRIKIPDGVFKACYTLKTKLRRSEKISSDRRWKQAMRLVQASAYLAGRDEATTDDLAILEHVLWEEPTDRPTVQRAVLELVNPNAREALDILDVVNALAADLAKKAALSDEEKALWGAREGLPKTNQAVTRLRALIKDAKKDGRPTASLVSALDRAKEVNQQVLVEAMGSAPDEAED
jgi:MoxR-like ATPase